VVASFSPSTPTPSNSGRTSRGLLGRYKPAFGANGSKGSASSSTGLNAKKEKKDKPSTTSKSNEGIEQNSAAYTRLKAKSVPAPEKREEIEEEETNENDTTGIFSLPEKEEEETNENESEIENESDATTISSLVEEEEDSLEEALSATAMAAKSEFVEEKKDMDNAVQSKEINIESSVDSPKEEVQQQEQSPPQQSPYLTALSGAIEATNDPTSTKTKTQLQSELLSKDAMYQNQIDALTEQAAADIQTLESNLVVLQHEYSNYQSSMEEQLKTLQVTASEKESALFQEMTTLLSKLEEEQAAVVQSVEKVEQLQQEISDLQQQITEMKQEYANTLHDLEDDYELEQNARTKEQAEHVSELKRVRQEAITHVEAVERGANEHTERVKVEYNKRHVEQQEAMESVQVKLTTVQSSLRDREDLIAEWASDRSSARTMTRQVWQLLKGRVVSRVRRIKNRFGFLFSDDAP
jgi:chromosome segregation ATPase